MYNLFVTYVAEDEESIHGFYEAVKEEGIIAASQAEEGNIRFDYYFSAERDNELLLLENWRNREAQEYHDQLPHMDNLDAIKAKYGIKTFIEEF